MGNWGQIFLELSDELLEGTSDISVESLSTQVAKRTHLADVASGTKC